MKELEHLRLLYQSKKNVFVENPDITNDYETASDFETACWTHAEFVRIHPFRDGNGRTSRLIMNYQLIKNGYLPVSIPVQDRSNYCKLLDDYCANNDMEPFTNYIMALEKEELRQMIALADQLSQA